MDHGNLKLCVNSSYNTIQIYPEITSGRVLDGELLYTKILEVNLCVFAYRLLHASTIFSHKLA